MTPTDNNYQNILKYKIIDDSSDGHFQGTDRNKKVFSDALHYSMDLFKKNDLISEQNDTIYQESVTLGHKIFDVIQKTRQKFMLKKLNQSWNTMEQGNNLSSELVKNEPNDFRNRNTQSYAYDYSETMRRQLYPNSLQLPNSVFGNNGNSFDTTEKFTIDNSGDDDDDDDKFNKQFGYTSKSLKYEFVPYEEKLRIVNLARENPDWTMKTLRERSGCKHVMNRDQLERWSEQCSLGGTREDRRKAINSWVFAKCVDYKNRGKKINNQLLKKWALEAASICIPPKNNPNNEFRASSWWMLNFKNLHGITGPSSDLIVNIGLPDPRYNNGNPEQSFHMAVHNAAQEYLNIDVESLEKNEMTLMSNTVGHTSFFDPTISGMIKRHERGVTFEEKLRVVHMARANPTWSVKMLREQSGCKQLTQIELLRRWEKQVTSGGSSADKIKKINQYVFQRCIEYQKKNYTVTNKTITSWAFDAKRELMMQNTTFTPSAGWLERFKNKYNIVGNPFDLKIKD